MLFVADVMSAELITISPVDTMKTAREIMHRARIRHLPVVSEGNLVGLLAQRDLLKATVSHLEKADRHERAKIETGVPVAEIMEKHVLTVPPGMPLIQAGEIMLSHKFGCLPVVDQGKLKGILTESDFVKLSLALLGSGGADGMPIL
jgi:CBS domain-containing membrane protein